MGSGPLWTDEEVAKLISLHSSHTNNELSEMLGRTVSSIRTKASNLHLIKSREAVSRASSSRTDAKIAEINSLSIDDVPLNIAFKHREWLRIKYYDEELSLYDIAVITGVTRKNIEYWMEKLGLPRRDNQERYTARYLNKISETGKGREPFSKGLTKHDHPSIMSISRNSSGELSHHWKGGTGVNSCGYRFISKKDHPKADKDGYVLEHRMVMEDIVGRVLDSHEIVHHRDKDRLNNSPENLYLFPSNKAHLNFHSYQNYKDPSITEEKFMEEVFPNEYQ